MTAKQRVFEVFTYPNTDRQAKRLLFASPLTTVRMAGDVLHDARQGFDPATSRAAELLQTELDRFETLLVDLLEVSRFDAGAALLDADDVNLVDVVHRVVEATKPLADQRGVRVRVEAPDHACLAEADQRRVERIVRNLITNAIDHAEAGGGDPGVVVRGTSDIWIKLARCCTPVPGDPIFGFTTRSGGVSVHRAACTNAAGLVVWQLGALPAGADATPPVAGSSVQLTVTVRVRRA